MLDRALEAIPKRKHVKLISKVSHSHPPSSTQTKQDSEVTAFSCLLLAAFGFPDLCSCRENCEQFAMMEYKLGSAERGRTLMEGVISSYPKRIDLWSVFIEMENKSGNIDGARRLCERAVTLRLRARQAKMFFKRWLQLERASGTPESEEAVKEKARKWVEDNAAA